MRKLFGILFVAVAAMCVMTSCSNNELSINDNQKLAGSQLIQNLEGLNDSVISSIAITRGKNWGEMTSKEKANVIKADLGGAAAGGKAGAELGAKLGTFAGSPITGGVFIAVCGAIGGAAISSWLAWPDYETTTSSPDNSDSASDALVVTPKVEKDCSTILYASKKTINDDLSINSNVVTVKDSTVNSKLEIDNDLITMSKLDETSLTVGKIHNLVLSIMDGSLTLNEEELLDEEARSSVESVFNNTEFIDSCKTIAVNVVNGVKTNGDDLAFHVIKLFESMLEEYSSQTDDIAFIIGKYKEIIDNTTELTQQQKEYIHYGLAVALYSSKYWEDKFKE